MSARAKLVTFAGSAAVALLVLVVALRWGGGITGRTIAGLPDAGPVTSWALPVVRVVLDASATVTLGWCVAAAFLLPGGDEPKILGPAAYRMLRRAGLSAAVWALSSLAVLVLTLSDLLGQPLAQISPSGVFSLAWSVSQGQALVVQAGLAVIVAVAARLVLSRNGAAWIAAAAAIATLPPALTGHAAAAGHHQLAVTSLAIHILAAALWVGGLVAVLGLRKHALLADVAARYSRLALACFVAVALSGLANAAVRLGSLDQLWQSRYGVLVLGKAVALLLVGAAGAVHRTRALPALRAGAARAFRRLAAGELIVFAGTFGLAVALSRTPTPVPSNPTDADPVTDLLGFAEPAPITAARLLGQPLLDAFFLTVVFVGIGAYLVGVWRMHKAGHAWSAARTASWVLGMLVLGASTCLGFGRYAYVLFSAHMAQHMLLAMVVPILLVGGAPVTLALRTLRRPADPAVRGPRDWLLTVIHSRVLQFFTHPVVALLIYVVSLYGLYMTSLLGTLMRYHLGHLAMLTHFVLAGYLFFWVIIGTDPGRRPVPTPVLVLVHFASMALHGFLGIVLMQSTSLIAADWYRSVHPAWAGSLLGDQHVGAGIAWAFGELPAAVVMGILVVRWIRDDEREQRRLDRAADRAEATGEEDAHAAYNAFLRELAQKERA
jgi:cytochrome c oxidase assembly factor CtaG